MKTFVYVYKSLLECLVLPMLHSKTIMESVMHFKFL
jgi:hypothetical protein